MRTISLRKHNSTIQPTPFEMTISILPAHAQNLSYRPNCEIKIIHTTSLIILNQPASISSQKLPIYIRHRNQDAMTNKVTNLHKEQNGFEGPKVTNLHTNKNTHQIEHGQSIALAFYGKMCYNDCRILIILLFEAYFLGVQHIN